MNDEYKTTVISFDKDKKEETQQIQEVVQNEKDSNVRNVLFNVTTKVPHVEQTLPAVKVTPSTTKIDARSVEKINTKSKYLPTFYKKELRRFAWLFWMWIGILVLVWGLEIWAVVAISKNSNVSNWVMLTLIPGAALSLAGLIVYANNYFNFRAEAKNADFSKEKLVTVNVMKLYKRLKSAHINVNWFCSLTYAVGLLTIGFVYLIAGCVTRSWGTLDATTLANFGGNTCLIIVIVSIVCIFIAFFLHVYLLITNYLRSSKIDQFYGQQIVSDEELEVIKKKKNKKDAIIFLAVVLVIVLIGILVYKLIQNKKVNNTVTINNK